MAVAFNPFTGEFNVYNKNLGNAAVVVAASDAPARVKASAAYICDGTADQVEINQALTTYQSVELSQGNFNLTASINVNTNQWLVGQGKNSSIINVGNSMNADAITTSATSLIYFGRIHGFKINGNKTNNTTGHGINMKYFHSWTIADCHIQESADNGVNMNGNAGNLALNNKLINCRVENTRNQGVFIDAYAPNNQVKDCIVGGTDNWYGIEVSNTEVILIGNHVHSAASDGIYLNSTEGICVGNISESNNGHGININGNKWTVTGNKARNNGYGGANKHGIYVQSDDNVITGNNCIDVQGTPTQRYGIYLETTSSGNKVSGNNYSGNLTGDWIDNGTDNFVDEDPGVAGGNDTEVQFNDGGILAGDSQFVWDKTNNRLRIGAGSLTTNHKKLVVTDRAFPSTNAGADGVLVDIDGGGGIYVTGSSGAIRMKYEAYGGEGGVGVQSNHPLKLYTNDAARVTIAANGDVSFTNDVTVPDEAYDATTWNGSLEVPTKNAVRDKIETLMPLSYLDTDATLAADSDSRVPSQKAIKAYVDATAQGLDVKQSVRAATTANITLSGTQTIDGISVAAGERVLVKNQSTASQNGIYACAAGSWSRTTDANTSAKVTSGLFTFVAEGTTNADSGWVLITDDPITLGSTSLSFTQFSGAGQITAGNGLAKTGNTLDVNVDSSTIEINADTLRVKDAGITEAKLSMADNTTADASTSKHGFVPKAPNDTAKFLRGDVTWAKASIIPSGGTLPASPSEGELFLHNPTGRVILMQYGNGAWNAVESYGAMTTYVDGTNGTDSADKGFGTGSNAYRTIQYATNAIPGVVGGNVTVNIASGTYNESVIVRGKTLTGNYTITFIGTLTELDSLTASSGTVGSGGSHGTVTRSTGTWTSNQRQHYLLKFTSGNNNGEIRVIETNNTTVATIVGKWAGTITNGDTFKTYDWGTIVSSTISFTIDGLQQGVNLENIKTTGSTQSLSIKSGCYLATKACNFGTYSRSDNGAVYPAYSFFTSASIVFLNYKGLLSPLACKFYETGDSWENVPSSAGGLMLLERGWNVIENGLYGIWSLANSYVNTYTADVSSNIIKSCTTGIYASRGGQVFGSNTYCTFSSNGTNVNADATTYAYAD